MTENGYPPGWDDARVRGVLDHYVHQSDEEAAAEDDASFDDIHSTTMDVPIELVPAVRELIAKQSSHGS